MNKLLTLALLPALLVAPATQAQSAASPGEEKQVWVAYLAAVGGTVAPIALGSLGLMGGNDAAVLAGLGVITAGMVAGPSLGQLYAGSTGHALAATALRAAGIGFFVAAIANAEGIGCMENPECENNTGDVFGVLSLVAYVGGMAYSAVETPFAVKRHNRRLRPARLEFAPTLALVPCDGVRARVGARTLLRF